MRVSVDFSPSDWHEIWEGYKTAFPEMERSIEYYIWSKCKRQGGGA